MHPLLDGSSASLALIASYSPLNARLDALLSFVSYRSKVLERELLHIDHVADLGEVKGQVVWAWSILNIIMCAAKKAGGCS